ncbi:hypothetical protein [Dysgonomonas termitidis]|uniref:Uncharacterized protein n=1 Tax=Dysgonomonas termitidis TaxID=1516126 RepID=A0ABV9KWY3_9BACT
MANLIQIKNGTNTVNSEADATTTLNGLALKKGEMAAISYIDTDSIEKSYWLLVMVK